MMKRFLSALATAALCSVAFAGCGGGTTPSVARVGTSSSGAGTSSGVRHIRSGCTPDSYGYCVVIHGSSHRTENCDGGGTATLSTYPLELYYYGTDEGTYVHIIDGCTGEDSWSPGDPAVVTGDPNLP